MRIAVHEPTPETLAEYARIPIAFEVSRVLDLTADRDGLGGFKLTEKPLARPYIKDYDSLPGGSPTGWSQRFQVSTWTIFLATDHRGAVGGLTLVTGDPALAILEGRSDLALLWDIRILPEARRQGLGSALFHSAEDWSRARDRRQLLAETQNVNLPACRFYRSHGCVLGSIDRLAYPELPEEVRLVWYKDLQGAPRR